MGTLWMGCRKGMYKGWREAFLQPSKRMDVSRVGRTHSSGAKALQVKGTSVLECMRVNGNSPYTQQCIWPVEALSSGRSTLDLSAVPV